MRTSTHTTRGNLSLAIAFLALLVALAEPAHAALGKGAVKAKNLANNAVKTAKIKDGAVITTKLANDSVTGPKVVNGAITRADLAGSSVDSAAVIDRSLRLSDLGGGGLVNQTTTLSSPISIAAGECQSVHLRTFVPTPAGLLGSMVVGTITTSAGGAVVDNDGFVLPTLVTETNQTGALTHLAVCAGGAPQTIPAGAIVTWSVIAS